MSWENTAKRRELSQGGVQLVVALTDGPKPCAREAVEFLSGP